MRVVVVLLLGFLILLGGGICQGGFADGEEGQLLPNIEGREYVAVFPEHYPAVRIYPKDPKNNTVWKEDYFLFALESFEEKSLCKCCYETKLDFFTTIDCDELNGLYRKDLRNVSWTTSWDPVVPQRLIWRTVDWVGDAELLIIYEDNPDERVVAVSNGQKERNLTVSKNSLKWSVQINNYTPVQPLPNNSTYFGLSFFFLTTLNREVHWTEWGAFQPLLQKSLFEDSYQMAWTICTEREPFFNVTFLQAMYSVAHPPSVSQEQYPEDPSEWGFEFTNLIQGEPVWSWVEAEGADEGSGGMVEVRTGQRLQVVYAGGQNMSYDPDISVMFEGVSVGEDGDGEDGADEAGNEAEEKENEGAEAARIVGIVVGVTLGVLVVLGLGGIAGYVGRGVLAKRKFNNFKAAGPNAVNF
ncbi:hypothetical protein QOT17_016764 [Balamuthia mandrillaris]